MAEDEFSEDESMDFLASASSASKPRKRSTSSASRSGNEKRKLMGTAAATLTTMDQDGVVGSVIGSAEPEKEPLHFDKNLFEEGKLVLNIEVGTRYVKVKYACTNITK